MVFPLSNEEHLAIKERIDSQVELIVAAAVRFDGATISFPRPARHQQAISWLHWKGLREPDGCYECGFLTNTGRFVDRKEAGRIILASGQGTYREGYTNPHGHVFSEDLWNDVDMEPQGPIHPASVF